jgi:toxin ParE1/3/4
MARLIVSAKAQADIANTLRWTTKRFGALAVGRCRQLLASALLDLSADPQRVGSVARPELGEGVRSYHVRHSRKRGDVANPRHLIVYRRREDDVVEVSRVLHDAMELARHVRFDTD